MFVNFWQKLNKPFFCLAPMEDVTDVAFREMFARYSTKHESENMNHGANSIKQKIADHVSSSMSQASLGNNFVMFTEFINVDGLTHPEGRKKLAIGLKYTEIQRPIVAQLWGRSPLKFEQAAKIIADLGFDGIDINMGCPQDKEISLGSCAALIREPQLAVEIIKYTKKGAGSLPVSVKTRIGYSNNTLGTWLRHLLSAEPAAIAVHGRTKKEKSKVPADWQAIAEAVRIRNSEQSATLIIGNGDVRSCQDGLSRAEQSGVDGIMVGRGAFGCPWFFRNDSYQPDLKTRLDIMIEHADLFNKLLGQDKPFVIMRKHFKAYASGFDGAHELRAKLMQVGDLAGAQKITGEFLASLPVR